MKLAVFCETSGILREALRRRGHDAVSIDLLPSEDGSPHHIVDDVRDYLAQSWDGFFAHPDCTYVSGSGWHWVKRGRIEEDGRPRLAHFEEAVAFARMLMEGKETAHIPRRGIENPVGRLSTMIRKPDCILQPYEFGDDASKATCLWLYGLRVPAKHWANRLPGRWVMHKGKRVERWANQTDSGQNKLAPSADRWKERSRTYPGIAEAIASLFDK